MHSNLLWERLDGTLKVILGTERAVGIVLLIDVRHPHYTSEYEKWSKFKKCSSTIAKILIG